MNTPSFVFPIAFPLILIVCGCGDDGEIYRPVEKPIKTPSRPVVNIETLPVGTAFRLVSSQSPRNDMLVRVQYFNVAWKDPQGNKRTGNIYDIYIIIKKGRVTSKPVFEKDFDYLWESTYIVRPLNPLHKVEHMRTLSRTGKLVPVDIPDGYKFIQYKVGESAYVTFGPGVPIHGLRK